MSLREESASGTSASAVRAAACNERDARGQVARVVVPRVNHGEECALGGLDQRGDAIAVNAAVSLVEEIDLLEAGSRAGY